MVERHGVKLADHQILAVEQKPGRDTAHDRLVHGPERAVVKFLFRSEDQHRIGLDELAGSVARNVPEEIDVVPEQRQALAEHRAGKTQVLDPERL